MRVGLIRFTVRKFSSVGIPLRGYVALAASLIGVCAFSG